jgi:cytoskeletal protein RodZ
MSAPNTNLDKQETQHRGPLRGMFAVVLFALVLLVILGFWAFNRGGTPEGAATQTEVTTGETESTGSTDAVSANDSPDEESDAATANEAADPSAVTVPSQTVQSPQIGQPDDINPVTGGSAASTPPQPVEETPAQDE